MASESTDGQSLAAFVIVVLAAIADAVSTRSIAIGTVTVAIPFVSLGLIVLATPAATGGTRMDLIFAMLITLAAVAVREVWARAVLPRVASARRT